MVYISFYYINNVQFAIFNLIKNIYPINFNILLKYVLNFFLLMNNKKVIKLFFYDLLFSHIKIFIFKIFLYIISKLQLQLLFIIYILYLICLNEFWNGNKYNHQLIIFSIFYYSFSSSVVVVILVYFL